jgi:2-aminoethylphosphonate-pyruvate transaminase
VVLDRRRQILFNPGPVNLDPTIKDNLFNVELCHRQPEFLELLDSVRRRLFSLLGFPPEEFRLGLLHGSGTLAVDAALATFVRGRVLVIDNGLYCRRFLETLSLIDDVDLTHIDLGIGGRIDLGLVASRIRDAKLDWVTMVHHETTTGLLNSVSDVSELCRELGVRLLVDAVSSIGAHAVDPRADVVCFNSSKCLESLPGIAGVFWKRDLSVSPVIPALDVRSYSESMPSTPNVQAFVALDTALDLLAAEDRPGRYRKLAQHVWEIGGRSFEPLLAEADRSSVLTAFRLGGRTIDELLALASTLDMVIYPGQAQLREEIFRVANMGVAIDERAIERLFAVIT